MGINPAWAEAPTSTGAEWFTLEFDGASRGNPGPASLGVVLRVPGRGALHRRKYLGWKTNNEAEYAGLLYGLQCALKNGARKIIIQGDSLLVINQVLGKYKVSTPHLQPLHTRAKELLEKFGSYVLSHIPREQNAEADALANKSLDRVMGRA